MIINCLFIIINGAAAYLLLQGMKKLIAVSEKRWKQAVLWGSCLLLLAMIIYLGDWANILPTVLFFLLVIRAVCEGSIWKKAAIGLMYSSTILSFNVLRDNFVLTTDVRWNHPTACMIIEGLLSLSVALCLYLAIGKYAPDREYHLSDSLWKLILLLNATPFGIVLSVVLLTTTEEERIWMKMPDGFKGYNILVLLLLSLLSFIGLFQAVIVLARQQQLEEQNMLAEVNQSYYAAMEEQHFAIRRLKHDLANHLAVAVTLPEAQREDYIKSLMEDSAFSRSLRYCADPIVNAVLTVKEEQMSRYGIRLEARIDIPKELPFEKTDICALFSNALDNAVEACRRLPEAQRYVRVKSRARKGLFCLEVTNPVEVVENRQSPQTGTARICDDNGGAHVFVEDRVEGRWERGKDRLPPTTKADKENHGFGLRSMKEIAERNHGAMEIRAEGGRFEVFLYMPLG